MNETKHLNLRIDEAIEHRNKNNHGTLNRKELGNIIFPDVKDTYAQVIFSHWASGKMNPKPELWQIKQMALICGVSVDYLFGVTDMPEPHPNLPANMITTLLLCEKELQKHYNVDESPSLQAIQTLKNKLV